jgi:membrane protease YdiL (CAAX protease family)
LSHIKTEHNISETIKNEINEFLQFRFNPSPELGVLVLSWIAVVIGLYLAFRVVTTNNVALNFILYGPVSILFLGTIVPIIYTVKVKKTDLSDLGVTEKYWIHSLIIGLVLGVITYLNTLTKVQLPPTENLVPLVAMALTVGLFEALFFRGWMQLGFERAFGAIPGIILGAAFYALYHIGYGMELPELWFLFTLGLQFALSFRLTKNILVLWPFYTWIGGMYSNLIDGLVMPFEATYGFVILLVLMLGSIIGTNQKTKNS